MTHRDLIPTVEVHAERVLHPEALSDLAAPSFSGARCSNEYELFDRASAGSSVARSVALQLCRECPCLQRCRDWFASLPVWDRPHGVVAGQLVTKKSSRTPW